LYCDDPSIAKNNIILYADDDTDDRIWISEACKTLNCSLQISFVENGRQVLDYLKSLSSVLPSLIVLDLNMPEMDGRQTLQYLKSNPSYKEIPVAIVSTSANKMDKDMCKQLGASLYITKPNIHVGWQGIIRQLEPFVNG
jgi:CheY-like chemotaxis protein